MRVIKRIFATILSLCMVLNLFSIKLYAGNDEQIKKKGNETTKDGITVSKIISETEFENVFDIKLKIETKSTIDNMVKKPPMSVVIVLDISNTMFTSYVGGNSYYNEAVESMKDFINSYASMAKGATMPRELSIVTFNTNAYVHQEMIDCSKNDVTGEAICTSFDNKIKNLIPDLEAYKGSTERYTNIEGGLRIAENILDKSNTENKYIILLTDGMPTTYNKNHEATSTTSIAGYDPEMAGARGPINNEGVFYDVLYDNYCDWGVNYSDIGAKYTEERAKKIKDKNISIYSIGINIDSQKIPMDESVRNNSGYGSIVDYKSGTEYVINCSTATKYSNAYKNWLYNEVGSKYYADGNDESQMTSAFSDIFNKMNESSKEYIEEGWKTSDPMNQSFTTKNVEFLSFITKNKEFADSLNGSSGVGNENKADFDLTKEMINWEIQNSGYTSKTDSSGTTYTYELDYRIRLKNEREGFVPNQNIETNGKTSLSYVVNDNGTVKKDSIDFSIPEVEGYLGKLEFTKKDELRDRVVPGASFSLTHNSECTVCKEIDKYSTPVDIGVMNASSDVNGKVVFDKIPSGHEYVLKETSAPIGYDINPNTFKIAVSYGKVTIDGALINEFTSITNPPKKYKLEYKIVSTDNPDSSKTDLTPDTVVDIPYDTDKIIEDKLNTTDKDNDGVPGLWSFSGWYDNEACSGTTISEINIKKDEMVYGRWDFEPFKYKVTYEVIPDSKYGVPKDSQTPVDSKIYAHNEFVDVVDNLTTIHNTSDGTATGIPGTWEFITWDKSDFNITSDTHIVGGWKFTPDPYTLEYVIVSTDNPSPDKTDATPLMEAGIPYNTDKEIAGKLSTTDDVKSGVPGKWEFSGWYDNSECTGTPISNINIKKNETVYGKWDFEPYTYTLNYEIVSTENPASKKTDATPSTVSSIPYNTDKEIAGKLSTTDDVKTVVPGTWKFSGWYDNSECIGIPISNINIKKNETVYGKWDFMPYTYTLNYEIVSTDNPSPDKTDATPLMEAGIPYNTDKEIAGKLSTTDDVKSGVPGKWEFSGWYDNSECTGTPISNINIKKNETVYGKWDFEPYTYTLNYEIVSTENPAPEKTEATPSLVTGIPYNTDKTIAGKLSTTDDVKTGVPGIWEFSGWYDNHGCTGTPIANINIKKNETVYGKWDFKPYTYILNYEIVSTENPSPEKTDETPLLEAGIPYDTDKAIAGKISTTDDEKSGVPGTWEFSGWYDNPECTGTPIADINIKKNETVYGKWEFIPDTYKVIYEVEGDDRFGVPEDSKTPVDGNIYNYEDLVIVKDKIISEWTSSDGTEDGIPGTWKFGEWDKVDFEITEDTVIHGKWEFIPDPYILEYVIVSTENPSPEKTDNLPELEAGIPYNTDIVIAEKITTTDDNKLGVPGEWKFSGWYDNYECMGNPIDNINIKKNEKVYGKWDFTPKKYKVTYEVIGDIIHGIPDDTIIPVEEFYDYEEMIIIADNPTTEWITSDGTEDGIPGTWEFVEWDKDNFKIIEDTVINGEWKFNPYIYELEYEIVSDENPIDEKTDKKPDKVTGIKYDTDIELELGLTTTDNKKGDLIGEWKFSGWYDNPECNGEIIDTKNIKKNEIVYGKWDFIPDLLDEEITTEPNTTPASTPTILPTEPTDDEITTTDEIVQNDEPVHTGDATNVCMYLIIMMISLFGLKLVFRRRV